KKLVRKEVSPGKHLTGDQWSVHRYGTDDNVGLVKFLFQKVKSAKPETTFFSEFLRPLRCAVEDNDLIKFRINKVFDDVLPDFTNAKHQYPGFFICRKVLHHLCSGIGQRSGTITKCSLLYHPLVRKENSMHQTVKERSRHVDVGAPLVRAFYLAAYLKIYHDPGVQAYGHFKKMSNGLFSIQRYEITVNCVLNAFYKFQAAKQFSTVIGFLLVINLGSVAGGNYEHIRCGSVFPRESQQLLNPLLI